MVEGIRSSSLEAGMVKKRASGRAKGGNNEHDGRESEREDGIAGGNGSGYGGGEVPAGEEEYDANTKQRKTYGRTPGGDVFVVPQTHDMVSTLLSPSQPKNLSDFVVLGILGGHIALLIFLHPTMRVNVFLVIFLFWRAAYNVGIGYLLHAQSKHKTLIYWARKSGIFNPEKQPLLYKIIKKEMTTKITDEEYEFDKAPIEFNTWLVFRRLVDLILMCDFVSYSLFAIACLRVPEGEGWMLGICRWLGGWVLIAFNVWVKLDAHRVVKDYAWYWGDFFFLIDQQLTFDGVFEMAPHPMYSVGYAGYYGLSLISASYTVLFTSLLAHTAQFVFLTFVENPHIDKTYNAPAPRRKSAPPLPEVKLLHEEQDADAIAMSRTATLNTITSSTAIFDELPPKTRPLVGKPDLFRQTDLATFLLIIYTLLLTILTSNSTFTKTLFIVHAVLWRLWFTVGIGSVLRAQSGSKAWTRHFVKVGEGRNEAWREWRGIYHLSLFGTWSSFLAAGWKCYEVPEYWGYGNGLALLTHTIGFLLITLQLWTSFSIYESLGEFGWFYGDFFFDSQPKLTYSGIYRYLNNPERLIGCAALWGMVLITSSASVFFLALLSHICTLLFIQLVERPHMQKLYGNQIRREAGLVRSIKRAFPPPVADSVGRVEKTVAKVLNEAQDLVQDFIFNQIQATRGPRRSEQVRFEGSSISGFVKDAGYLFRQYPALWTIAQTSSGVEGYDARLYSLTLVNPSKKKFEKGRAEPVSRSSTPERAPSITTATTANTSSTTNEEFKSLSFSYGEPIRVKWTAAANHSKTDWIGLYRVADNASRNVTRIASMGRWVATCPGQYDTGLAEIGCLASDRKCTRLPPSLTTVEPSAVREGDVLEGAVVFEGDKIFWQAGVYEFRYHHDGKHTVMAISLPFEIVLPPAMPPTSSSTSTSSSLDDRPTPPWSSEATIAQIEATLLPVVRNCFDRDEEKGAPATVTDEFGGGQDVEKYARRVVYAVKEMYGVDFAPDVVQADGCVRRLAWRVGNAKMVLAPFSMSSTGNSTPGSPRY